MRQLTLLLLGGFEVRTGAGQLLPVPTRKAQALLAYLALTPGQAHPRDKLAALLWGEATPVAARNALRQSLFILRKALGQAGATAFQVAGDSVTMPPGTIGTDVSEFEQAAARGSPSALEEAARLYRGDLLAGVGIGTPAFEDWLMSERERLRELELEILARLLVHQRASGAAAAAIQTALRLLAVDPLQEPVHRALMRLHVQLDRRADALRQYQHCVAVLQRELGIEPETETKLLYREILRQRPVRPTPGAVGAQLAETPLVGRAGQVASLAEALGAAWAGRGRLLALIGEAGIGKSRLLGELAAEAQRREGGVLLGRAYESEQILPFGPWVSALRDAGVPGDPGVLAGLEEVWRAELARLFPELAGEAPSAAGADRLRLFEALSHLLHGLALARPLLVILEDCHWADEMTLRFLAFFARRLRAAPILVAVSAREEELGDSPVLARMLDALAGEGRLDRLDLGRLSRDDTVALVRLLGRGEGREDAVAQQVWTASEGNPFIVVETMHAIDHGLPVQTGSTVPLPARVREMITGRLERLGSLGRQVAGVAAVIGREFEFSLVQQAAGLGAGDTAEGLEELVRRRVVEGVGDRFDFTHERIREVAYDRLSIPHRRLLHGAVGAALEVLQVGNLEIHCAALAFHYRQGEVWPKALAYLRQAGDQAMARGAYGESAARFEQALAVAERLADGPDTVRASLELRLRLRNALLPLGDHARMLGNLRAAEAVAERLGDQRRLGLILSHLALELWRAGDGEGAIELAERILRDAKPPEDAELRIMAWLRLGQARHSLGRYAEAIGPLRAVLSALPGDRALETYGLAAPPAVIGRTWLAWCLAELGELVEAREQAEEGLRIAERVGQPYALAAACFALGLVRLRRGDAAGAIPGLERGLGLCRAGEIPVFFSWTASALAVAHATGGRRERARALLAPSMEADILAKAAGQPFPLLGLGEAHLLAGEPAEASQRARRALDLARVRREAGHEAYALRLQAEAAASGAEGDPRAAEHLYGEARTLAEGLGMRPLQAHCDAGLGRLHRRLGRVAEADARLAAASEAFREMGADFAPA